MASQASQDGPTALDELGETTSQLLGLEMLMAQQVPRVKLPRIEPPPDHPLMSVQRVAALLGCSDMTIRRRIAARQFPAVKIGRKSMVPRSFVERLLAQAEAGETVIVDEQVGSGADPALTQMSPGGIPARRGDASEALGEDHSMPSHATRRRRQ